MTDFSKEHFDEYDEKVDFQARKLSYYYEDDIVVSGMAGRFPESENIKEFRDNLMNGVDMVTIDDRRWKPGFLKLPPSSGKLKELDRFDNEYFNFNPKYAEECDPQIRMLLECAYEAFADAGIPPYSVSSWNTGVFVGICSMDSFFSLVGEGEQMSGYKTVGLSRNMTANRISYFFNLRGPSFALDTACSSGLSSVGCAISAIRNGDCDSAIVCACNLCLHPVYTSTFNNLGMLAKDGKSGAFSKHSTGYVRSEAIVAIFLQKVGDAKRIYSSLIHYKTNTDGYKPQGITYPSMRTQTKLLKEVYAEANVDIQDIEYLEAHGTGTPVGDPIEGNVISKTFLENRNTPLLLGSTKSNMGHSEATSGLTSMVKVIIAMEENMIPKSLHFEEPNPDIPALFDGRVKIVAENTPWKGGLSGVSAFGFGGVNVHVIMRSNTIERRSDDVMAEGEVRLFAFSGRTQEAVDCMLSHMESNPDPNLYGLLTEMMETPAKLHPFRGYTLLNNKTPVRQIEKVKNEQHPVWFIFAGMGPQWAGMGRDHMQLEVFRRSIMKSSEVIKPYGIDVYDLIMNGTDENFEELLNNFVSIAAIQIALVDTLRVLGIEADGMVGHSVGELGCAYADGCLDAEQTMLAAYWRGKCVVDSNLAPGAMAAVGLTESEVNRTAPPGVVAACHNAEDSMTISGEAEAMKAYVEQLKTKNIFVRTVKSSGFAFHCHYMNAIGPSLLEKLMPVIPNPKQRSSKWISSSVPQSKWDSDLAMTCSGEYLVNNLTSPVLFYEAMDFVPSNAILIEVAPHCILQAILKRSLGPDAIYLGTMKRNHPNNLEYFLTNVGMMYLNGMKPTISKLYPPVSFPVPRGTPMISPYIKWNHSRKWYYPNMIDFCRQGIGIKRSYDITLKSSEDYYLTDHNIDGRVLLPASAYIVLAWKAFANSKGNLLQTQSVILENLVLHRATVLSNKAPVKVFINLTESTGTFEISESGSLLASGVAKTYNEDANSKFVKDESFAKFEFNLEKKDIYKELHLRGYKYGPNFQGIIGADLEGENVMLEWKDNWITFIDSMLQCAVLSNDSRLLRVPVSFRSIIIDPVRHAKAVELVKENELDGMPLVGNSRTKMISSGGVIIEDLVTNVIAHRQVKQNPLLEEYRFVPYEQPRCYFDDPDYENELREYNQTCSSLTSKILEKLKSQKQMNSEDVPNDNSKTEATTDEENLKDTNFSLLKALESIEQLSVDSTFQTNTAEILESLKDEEDFLLDALLSEKTLKSCLDLVFENTTSKATKIVEIQGNYPQLTKKFTSILNFYSGFKPKTDYIVTHNTDIQSADRISGVSYKECDILKESLLGEAINLVIARGLMSSESKNIELYLENIKDSMNSTGFLLLIEPRKDSILFSKLCALKGEETSQIPTQDEIRKLLQKSGLEVVAYKSDGIYQELYLLRKTCHKAFKVIQISENNTGSWLEELKTNLQDEENNYGKNIWLLSRDEPTNGILGLVNCLRLEPGGDKIRCVFLMEPMPQSNVVQNLVKKDLVMNVYRDGKWGSMRHLPINTDVMKMTESTFVTIRQKGDFSTLSWFESYLNNKISCSKKNICYNYCAAMNFRDVLLAANRITVDTLPKGYEELESMLGYEFAGRDKNGNRIMGISSDCFASEVAPNPFFTWNVPDGWTMEEAVTVPVVYATVYYAFFVKGKLKSGDSILIHCGSGGVGQAAITVALSLGCQIYTTVGTDEKREFLKERFNLKDDQIGYSRDTSFEGWILEKTDGKGVDFVLNSLSEDKLKASLRCLAPHGTFLEIGKYDFMMNNSLQMRMFLQNINFVSVMLDKTFESPTDEVVKLVDEGIRNGVVQPLSRIVYDKSQIAEAFKFMASGKHIGKIIIKFREEENALDAKPKPIPMMAIPRIYVHPQKAIIITGGLGGFGIELTRWLIERKASHVILSSRSGIKTGYQRRCVHLWRNKGINVVINTSDITTEAGVNELISEASKYGPVGGIFHLAMVLKDALFENQTEEMFEEVVGPKVKAARLLDRISRKNCPCLEWFVVFSSVACGRGNIGQTNYAYANSSMERICELRRKDNLPGLAIQWGPIGDVGVVFEATGGQDVTIAGTMSQRIQSCLEVLEKFLIQNCSVVSSIVLEGLKNKTSAGDKQNLFENCCTILGIKDVSTVDSSLTLADFGIDSLMAVELRQILERDFEMFLSLQEVRDLTLEKIQRFSEAMGDVSIINEETSAASGSANKSQQKQLSKRRLSGEGLDSLQTISALNDKKFGNPLFLIHGYENSVKIFETVASKLKCPVYGLQCTSENDLKSIRDVAKEYLQRIRSIQANGPYHIAGYTFGAKIAVEIASQLQSKQEIGSLILFDGSHLYSDLLFAHQSGSNLGDEIDAEALCIFVDQFVNFNFQEIKSSLLKLKSYEDRLDYIENLARNGHPLGIIKTAAKILLNSLRLGYLDKRVSKFRGTAILLNFTDPKRPCNTGTNFQEVIDGKLKIKQLKGSCDSIVKEPIAVRLANVINEYLNV